jgi:uncharacterized membrane protein YjjB (DUF3815 family)
VANTVFSVCAALASVVVSALAAHRGVWAVAIVFGALAFGFTARAIERLWRGER